MTNSRADVFRDRTIDVLREIVQEHHFLGRSAVQPADPASRAVLMRIGANRPEFSLSVYDGVNAMLEQEIAEFTDAQTRDLSKKDLVNARNRINNFPVSGELSWVTALGWLETMLPDVTGQILYLPRPITVDHVGSVDVIHWTWRRGSQFASFEGTDEAGVEPVPSGLYVSLYRNKPITVDSGTIRLDYPATGLLSFAVRRDHPTAAASELRNGKTYAFVMKDEHDKKRVDSALAWILALNS